MLIELCEKDWRIIKMLVPVILFVIGLIALIKGGDWFVDGATGIAHKFHMPEILIGATVVSIGTTIPEVMVSSIAALTEGASSIAYGNAIGSIICNTSLIAAITLAVRPAPIDRKSIQMPVVFFFVAAIFYVAVAYITGYFSRTVGIVLLAGFVVYIFLSVKAAMKPQTKAGNILEASSQTSELEKAATDEEDKEADINAAEVETTNSTLKDIILLVLGAVLIAVGANLLVDNGTIIAEALGVPQSVIALTFVALGTSLPELVTAISALIKGHSDLSLGNVIGANLFNLVLVTGMATTLSPFHIPVEKTIAGMNGSLVLDIPVMLTVMLIMCVPAIVKQKLYRAQGIVLLIIYFAFIGSQFIL